MSSWQAAEDTEADSWLYITAQWIVQTRWLIRRSSRSSSSDKERKSAMNANISPITEVRDGYLFCLLMLMLMLSAVPGTSSTWWLLLTRPHLRTCSRRSTFGLIYTDNRSNTWLCWHWRGGKWWFRQSSKLSCTSSRCRACNKKEGETKKASNCWKNH